jgi:hypothetical protein
VGDRSGDSGAGLTSLDPAMTSGRISPMITMIAMTTNALPMVLTSPVWISVSCQASSANPAIVTALT